jgi:hypothetical protein
LTVEGQREREKLKHNVNEFVSTAIVARGESVASIVPYFFHRGDRRRLERSIGFIGVPVNGSIGSSMVGIWACAYTSGFA